MSEITKVIYINQDRAAHRRWSCHGALVAQGASPDIIFRFRSMSDFYPHVKTPDEIAKIACRDFPRFKDYESYFEVDLGFEIDFGLLGSIYSMLTLLSRVADRDETVLILQDDMILRKPFGGIQRIVEKLSSDILMLRHNSPEKSMASEKNQRTMVRKRVSPRYTKLESHPTQKDILQGIAGHGVWANVVSGHGARCILDEWGTEGCPFSVEYTLWNMSFRENQDGFFSVKEPHRWFSDSTNWTKQHRKNTVPGIVNDANINGATSDSLFV